MSDSMDCSIVTPTKKVFEGKITYISAPGKVGEFGALAGHENFITVLDIGVVGIETQESQKSEFFIIGGYFDISNDKIILIADEAYTKDEIDRSFASNKADEYKNKLSALSFNDKDYKKMKYKFDKYSKMLEFAS